MPLFLIAFVVDVAVDPDIDIELDAMLGPLTVHDFILLPEPAAISLSVILTLDLFCT